MDQIIAKVATPENVALVALILTFGWVMRWLLTTLAHEIRDGKDAILRIGDRMDKNLTKLTVAQINMQKLMIEHDTNERLYLPRVMPDVPSEREKNVLQTLQDTKQMLAEQAKALEEG